MTPIFDPTSDLAGVADGTEPVTLLRRGSTSGGSGERIVHALRRAITTGEAAIIVQGDVRKTVASGGQCTDADLVWHLPAAELAQPPQLGDVIVDGHGALDDPGGEADHARRPLALRDPERRRSRSAWTTRSPCSS